mmetsp:Transcript_4066/g.12127  ORF Transcript_4066/g.12127 Transcript_4066/m.12127 type:complete len:629 (-) Transcript_4066:762-2648(-)
MACAAAGCGAHAVRIRTSAPTTASSPSSSPASSSSSPPPPSLAAQLPASTALAASSADSAVLANCASAAALAARSRAARSFAAASCATFIAAASATNALAMDGTALGCSASIVATALLAVQHLERRAAARRASEVERPLTAPPTCGSSARDVCSDTIAPSASGSSEQLCSAASAFGNSTSSPTPFGVPCTTRTREATAPPPTISARSRGWIDRLPSAVAACSASARSDEPACRPSAPTSAPLCARSVSLPPLPDERLARSAAAPTRPSTATAPSGAQSTPISRSCAPSPAASRFVSVRTFSWRHASDSSRSCADSGRTAAMSATRAARALSSGSSAAVGTTRRSSRRICVAPPHSYSSSWLRRSRHATPSSAADAAASAPSPPAGIACSSRFTPPACRSATRWATESRSSAASDVAALRPNVLCERSRWRSAGWSWIEPTMGPRAASWSAQPYRQSHSSFQCERSATESSAPTRTSRVSASEPGAHRPDAPSGWPARERLTMVLLSVTARASWRAHWARRGCDLSTAAERSGHTASQSTVTRRDSPMASVSAASASVGDIVSWLPERSRWRRVPHWWTRRARASAPCAWKQLSATLSFASARAARSDWQSRTMPASPSWQRDACSSTR